MFSLIFSFRCGPRENAKSGCLAEMQDFLKAALQDQPGIGHGDLAQVFSSGGLAQVLISLPMGPVQKIMTDVGKITV